MACPSLTRSQTAGLLNSTTGARSPVGLPPVSPLEVGIHYFPAFAVASNGNRGAASEIVAAVFGRAGYQTYYARDMLNNIGFVIFDTVQESTRIAGVSCPAPETAMVVCSPSCATAVWERRQQQRRDPVLQLGRTRVRELRRAGLPLS